MLLLDNLRAFETTQDPGPTEATQGCLKSISATLGGDLLWTCQGVGRRNRQNIPQGMKGICCNQSDRGASQPAKDASPPAGTPQAPRDASLVEHTNDRGAIQPAASRTMRSRAETAFDNMCANKINVAIIIIVVQPVCLCRRTPFKISFLHLSMVMMLIIMMTTRRDCGSLCNLYASAVGHLS